MADFKDLIGDLEQVELYKKWHKEYAEDVQAAIENDLEGIEEARKRLKSINKLLNEIGIYPNEIRGKIYYNTYTYTDKKTGNVYNIKDDRKYIEDYRKNISTQLSGTYKLIGKHNQALAEHLEKYIKRGKECVYRPYQDLRINWCVNY